MPTYDQNDVFSSTSQFLSPPKSTLQKVSSRHNLNNKRSNSSLHGSSSLAHSMEGDAAGNGRFSLAHELAVALMPEPSAGSKLLAEEFGIEYDEGAEGIDEDSVHERVQEDNATIPPSFADELSTMDGASFDAIPGHEQESTDIDPVFASPSLKKHKVPKGLPQDPMELLAQDLESTDKFLSHLRHIDSEHGSSTLQLPALEKIASDVIRRLNDTARDREGQVRELLGYEREFRKIAGEVGGNDVLGQLEELKEMKELLKEDEEEQGPFKSNHSRSNSQSTPVDVFARHSRAESTEEWNIEIRNPDYDAEDDASELAPTPIKDTFPPPPPLKGPPSPASTVPQLAHLRTINTSLVTTLSTLSEHAQVNGAATTEAGRKIRALKNKIGTWRTDWDSAERSRIKIERWEAGILDDSDPTDASPSHTSSGYKRLDGRTIVQEHLQAFERALADAGMKTKAIMASG